MRKFMINVNGKSYEVEVEEIRDGVAAFAPAAAPVSAPAAAPVPAPAPKPAAAPSGPAGGTKVASPMPGTIVDVKVKVGDSISEGQVVCILEAMKMENEIVAPAAGKVATVNVTRGASVNTGDVLVTIG